jgi:CheY-like chemotaxis protein
MSAGRVLFADDQEDIRNLVKFLLEAGGFEVTLAADGAEAVALLDEVDPDVVVTDMQMPRVDGLDLCRAVRDNPAHQDVPFILLTGFTLDNDRVRELATMTDTVLMVKTDIRELPAHVAALIDMQPRGEGAPAA